MDATSAAGGAAVVGSGRAPIRVVDDRNEV